MSGLRVALALAALSLPALLACARGGGEPPPSPAALYEQDPKAVRRGRLLFTGNCGGYCHSTTPGNREAPYLFDCVWKHGGSDLEIFTTISLGVPNTRMPSWQGKMPQGDEDLWKLVAYLRSARSCEGPG